MYYLLSKTNGVQSNVNKTESSQTCTFIRNYRIFDANLHHDSKQSDISRLYQMNLAISLNRFYFPSYFIIPFQWIPHITSPINNLLINRRLSEETRGGNLPSTASTHSLRMFCISLDDLILWALSILWLRGQCHVRWKIQKHIWMFSDT